MRLYKIAVYTRATYDLKLLGYQIMSGSADGFMQLKVSGRQASDVVWSNADAAEQTQTDEQYTGIYGSFRESVLVKAGV